MQENTPFNLVRALKEGDERAVKYLFNGFYGPLCYFAEQLTHDKTEAEDIAICTINKAWQKCAEFNTLSHLKAFLYVTAKNQCLNFIKQTRNRNRVLKAGSFLKEAPVVDMEQHLVMGDLIRRIHAEIANMPPKSRRIIQLSFLEELSSAEIAARLNISSDEVRARKSEAVRILRKLLERKNLLISFLSPLLFFFMLSPYSGRTSLT